MNVLNMKNICRIPIHIKSDNDVYKEDLFCLARAFQMFMNLFFVENSKRSHEIFRVEIKPSTSRLLHYIVLAPQLPQLLNHLELVATFVDVLHITHHTCPFHNNGVKVDWELLTKSHIEKIGHGRPCNILKETKARYQARMRLARKQHILTSLDTLHVVVAGANHRIMNLGRGSMRLFGGQMVRYWQRGCSNCTESGFGLCHQHQEKMDLLVNACECYRNVWSNLYMQESTSFSCKAAGIKTRDILKTLDLVTTIIDNRQHFVVGKRVPAYYLPAWTPGTLLTSDTAVDVLFKKYQENKKTHKKSAIVIGGPLGAGKSWVWKTFVRNLALENRGHLFSTKGSLLVVVVVPRISLCAAIANDMRTSLQGMKVEVVIYNENDGTHSLTGLRCGQRVVYVTVVNSIMKMCLLHVDIIILDEIETISGNLCGSLMNGEESQMALRTLHSMISDAMLTICMEGTMARATPPLFIKKIKSAIFLRLSPRRIEQQILVLCKLQSPMFPTDLDKPDSEDFFSILCAVAASPHSKVAICVGSLRTAHSLRVLLRYNTDRSVLLVSDDGEGDVCEQFTKCKHYDVTILTPVVSVGISEATCTFTHVFVYVQVSPHTMGLPHYIQMMARMRHVKYPHTFVAFSRPYSYKDSTSTLPIDLRLATLQVGREWLASQWKASASKLTKDFIKMWAPNYTSCLPGSELECDPCVVQYNYGLIEKHVSMSPGSVVRPTAKERGRCRAKLRVVLAAESTCITTVQDIDWIHRGACVDPEQGLCLMHGLKDSFTFVRETHCLHGQRMVANHGFFRPLSTFSKPTSKNTEMAEPHEHNKFVHQHLQTPSPPHALYSEQMQNWMSFHAP